MLNYIIEVQIAWMFLYAFYAAALKRETYFYVNRWYLLTTVMMGMLLPFVKMSQTPIEATVLTTNYLIERVTVGQGLSNIQSWWQSEAYIIWLLYWIVASILMIRFFGGLRHIWSLLFTADLERQREFWIAYSDKVDAPFSFFRFLVLPKGKNWSDRELEAIINHERVHINSWHSLDRLFIELCSIFFWFSPFIWLYRRSIIDIHEFEADARMRNQYGIRFYGNLLISQTHNAKGFMKATIGSSIFTNQLTRRIQMMAKRPSNDYSLFKYLLSIPVLLLGLFVISCQDNLQTGQNQNEIDDNKIVDINLENEDQVFDRVEKMPQYGKGDEDLMSYLAENIKYPASAREDSIEGTVVLQFIVNKDGDVIDPVVVRAVGGGCDDEALRVVESMPRWQPGRDINNNPVDVKFTLPIRFRLE